MFNDEYSSKPEAVIGIPPHHDQWTLEEMIDIFYHLLVNGWLDPREMSVGMSRSYGQSLGHYGRRLLEQQDAARENFTEGLNVIQGAFGGRP